ncbi:MAG: PilZ domain-containing protein [Acidobacteria bacterium]|nr:PilZ domain-containing protein [Acidobacteriota bacterium]
MLESEFSHDAAATERLDLEPNDSASSLRQSPVGLDLNRLVQHHRLGPLVRKLFPDQRRYERLILPNVVGYLGRAHASRPHKIADISVGGFCMRSDHFWTPGTELTITLQREDWDGDESSQLVTVQAMVVRCGPQHVGFSIALHDRKRMPSSEVFEQSLRIGKSEMAGFLADLQKPKLTRAVPVPPPSQRPMLLSERTRLLLEIAGSYRLSAASELWYEKGDTAYSRSIFKADRNA